MVTKQIFNLPIEAGVYTEETERGAQSRWHDADKVRFRKGLPEKIGGWTRLEPQFRGKCRKIIDWSSLDGRQWTAIGTELKLYLWQDTSLYDITPIRRSLTLANNPFATTSGSPIVVVTDAANGAQVNDFVRFSGATVVAGLTLNSEYQIVDILTINTYSIDAGSNASSTTTGGGAAVVASYDISVGTESSVISNGYGTGPYSSSGYSEPIVASKAITTLRTWSLDQWGEDLMACPFGGAIYWWDRTNGPTTRAVVLAVANTPQFNNYIVISQSSRQIIALGAYDSVNARSDPLLIRWCSQEDFNTWLPDVTNTAGDIRVFNGSKLITGIRARGETLIFTDSSVHSLVSLGTAGFGVTILGENISILSPNAAVALDHRVFFMAEGDFYLYDGVLQVLQCDVRNRVYESLTVDQKTKVHAGLNRTFNEVWWWYPALPDDIWFDGDFSLSDEDVDMRMQAIGDVPLWADDFWASSLWADDFWIEDNPSEIRYQVEFNSGGFIELTDCPVLGGPYDAVYTTNSGAPIENQLFVDYEMVFTLVGTPNMLFGMVFNMTDLHSVKDTAADNISGLVIDINPSTSVLRIRKRDSAGAVGGAPDNAVSSYSLIGLTTPITLTDSSTYALTMSRSGATISIYFWDATLDITQLVVSFDLTSAEQALYSGGAAGILLWGKDSATQATSNVHVHSFRIAEAGTLVAENPGVTPIEYTRNIATEITRYAMFNYQEGTWSIGTMPRTAWHDRSPVLEKPYAAGTDGYLYKHETGVDDHEDALESHIESYMMEIPDAGEQLMFVDKLIPDFLTLEGSVRVSVRGRKYPQSGTLIEKGPFTITSSTQFISPRMRARQVSLRIESDDVGDKWRSGRWRGQAGAHGKRGA